MVGAGKYIYLRWVLTNLKEYFETFIEYAVYSINETPSQIPLLFGVVSCISGLIGIISAAIITPILRKRIKAADAVVCAIGSLVASPILFILVLIPRHINLIGYWVLVVVAVSSMSLCWTLVADIMLYCVEPTRRSIASAISILVSHVFGDAISPYVIGAVSSRRKTSDDKKIFPILI